MALRLQILRSDPIKNLLIRSLSQATSGYTPTQANPPPASSQGASAVKEVPGLSEKCVKKTTGPVGPGAKLDGDYKVPEYFSYNNMSYYEAEIEMSQFRCPQPKAK